MEEIVETAAQFAFIAAFSALALSTVVRCAMAVAVARRRAVTAEGPVIQSAAPMSWPSTSASALTWLGFASLTVSLGLRAASAGRGPFSNQYEFALSFAWGIVGAALLAERRYGRPALGALALPVALLLMWYATTMSPAVRSLPPALQNNLLLSVHVAVAVFAYGAFTVAFAAALLYLGQSAAGANSTSLRELDAIGYRAVTIGFPSLALVIVLGAYWANIAWGTYWSWDPKETASLVTWLIYGGYLHARGLRGWSGRRAAILLIAGFVATALTFLGNTFFGGLHSYAGV
jgi:cytochrome c-type biogenesis protein CcsB